MNRRLFVQGSLAVGAVTLLHPHALAVQSTPATDDYPELELVLTDTGFKFPVDIAAGRYHVTVSNSGTSTDAHTVFARLPDDVSNDQFMTLMENGGEGFDFNTMQGTGFPDWPRPGGSVTGISDLLPGRYILFDPFDTRGNQFVEVTGAMPAVVDPVADFDFTIGEMVINMPEKPLTAAPARWHISNIGAVVHELAVLAVPVDFTFDDFMAMMMLPEDATPTPDMTVIEYLPVSGTALLGAGGQTWLDVELPGPGHYMALCMFPDDQGMPHAMSGMYSFFDVE